MHFSFLTFYTIYLELVELPLNTWPKAIGVLELFLFWSLCLFPSGKEMGEVDMREEYENSRLSTS